MILLLLLGCASVAAVGLLYLSVAWPRAILYVILAALPTQFIFFPVGNFFLSPADILVVIGALGLGLRLGAGDTASWQTVWRHRWLLAMIGGYLLGSLALGDPSRTLVRVLLGIVPSLLAYTYLRTARSVRMALLCVMIAGAGDAIYGLINRLAGFEIPGGRFTAIAGVNFDAMVTLSAAAIGWALWAKIRKLMGAAVLTASGVATLSRGGLIAFAAALGSAVFPVMRPKAKTALLATAIAVALIAVNVPFVQERVRARLEERTLDIEGAKTSTEIRLMVSRAALRGFLDRPVTGLGFGAFLDYSTSDREIAHASYGEGVVTHNTPLEILVEGGVLASAPFLIFSVGLFGVALTLLRRARRRRDRLAAAAVAPLVIVGLSAMLANILLHYFAWAIVGIALACERLRDEATVAGRTDAVGERGVAVRS